MIASSGADRLLMARLVAGEGFGRLRRGLGAPGRVLAGWRARTPERLVVAPQDLRTSDPTVAEDMYGGYFTFAGKAVYGHGHSPFELEPPSDEWRRALLGFGWLRHLRAADTALSRANARAMVEDWMAIAGRPPAGDPAGRQAYAAGWDAIIVSRRLLSFMSQSPLILEGADRDFYRRFMRSIGRQAAWLQHVLSGGLAGEARLFAAIALAELGVCAERMPRLRRKGTKWLVEELNAQILADGGHVSRNPRLIVELLLDLLPLRQTYAGRAVKAPDELLNAIDRMMPMLRLFRHANGELAAFNGMGSTPPDALSTLLAYDDVGGAAPLVAGPSGYQRFEAGSSLLIVDAGASPPRPFSGAAHAGCLSFELSDGADRIIVNCGAPDRGPPDALEAARQTAAHSTLAIADTSSCRFAATRAMRQWLARRILSGPRRVEGARDETRNGLHAEHDGYVRRFGLRHRREMTLGEGLLEGEDRLVAQGRGERADLAFALRFHLHPNVRAERLDERILLRLGSGARWIFEAEGALPTLEESIFFAGPEGGRRCDQIVLTAASPRTQALAWRLRRLD